MTDLITRRPRFLDTLQVCDFKAVAAQGCYVYCYLRTADGTPYYVGIASDWQRPVGRHTVVVPKDRHRIRILRSGLTQEKARGWEMRYIAHWGRQDIGTGILRNRTDGGEGLRGLIRTPTHCARISAALMGNQPSPETLAKLSKIRKGRKLSPDHYAKLLAGRKGKPLTPAHRANISAGKMGGIVAAETRTRISAALLAEGAAELGISVDEYKILSPGQRYRRRQNVRAASLLG